MYLSSEFARVRIGLAAGLALVAVMAPAHASPSAPADAATPPGTAQCARLPSSERDLCAQAGSLKSRALKSRDSIAVAQRTVPEESPARPSGAWIASEAVDAQFASTLRRVVTACAGPFQMQLVDAQPEPEVRFRCVPR